MDVDAGMVVVVVVVVVVVLGELGVGEVDLDMECAIFDHRSDWAGAVNSVRWTPTPISP